MAGCDKDFTSRYFRFTEGDRANMNRTKHSVIISLFASMGSGKAHYTKAGVEKIRTLLAKYHNIQIQRRWLFYCLHDIEAAGFIRRKKRFKQDISTEIRQLPSLVSFTLEGIKYLVKKRVSGAVQLLNQMMKFIQKGDKRFPGEDPDGFKFTDDEIVANKARFQKLLKTLA